MSTNTPTAQELLRLFKCIVLTGTPVLTNFAKVKLLPPYNGKFELFLDDKKHEIFHLWQSQKLLCCACPPAGCSLKRTNHMSSWILKKMYDDNGPEDRRHIVSISGRVVQVCLHKFVKRPIPIHELDISVISFLLRNLANLSVAETTSLDIITTHRSQICHAHAMTCYPTATLNTSWTELENALIDLADPSYKLMIRDQIKNLRKVDLEKEEITEILCNIETVSKEVKALSNNNIDYLNGMEKRLENKSIRNTEDIKQHTTDETRYAAAQVQQALSENIQDTEEYLKTSIKQEVKQVIESQEHSFQNIGTQLHKNRLETKEAHEKTQGMLVEVARTIQNLKLSVKYDMYERPTNLLVPEEPCSVATERPVLWQLGTPEHWNLDAVEATLRNPLRKDEIFKMKFVKKGSLIMLTTIAASVLSNSGAFEAAIFSFLTKMIEDCDINTEIPGRVDVRLHILNANEVSVSCEFPLGVQHKHNSGIPTKMTEFNKFDVAFLNGDDEQEIEWVQNMSTRLKTKFDLNCAILAKDCLSGFPLRKRLGKYFNMFQAVIVTLTKDNHTQYDFYIEDEMSVIAVELDYVNEIRSNLRKCPYVNCTICEDLWFPRLIDIIKTKLPDHLKKNIENNTDEVDVNCKKCWNSVTSAVYHGIELRMGLREMRLILCGSLTDEAWILNLMYQMTNFTEPYMITTWNKSIGTPLPFIAKTICVLNSHNLLKCKQMIDHIYRYQNDATIALKLVNIAPADRPCGSLWVDSYIDATCVNYKELADKIFLSVENVRQTQRQKSQPAEIPKAKDVRQTQRKKSQPKENQKAKDPVFVCMAEQCIDNSPAAATIMIMCVFCKQQSAQWKCEKCGHMCNNCRKQFHNRLSAPHRVSSLKETEKIFSNMAKHPNEATTQVAIMCVFCEQPNVKWKCEECGYQCNVCEEKVHRRLKASKMHNISSLKDIRKNIYYEDQPWYHGNITRNEAVKLLQKHKYMGDGAFLVRECQSSIGSFVIDCMLSGEPKHVQIKTKEISGQLKYYVGGEPFDGLNDVIEFFKSTALSLKTTGPTTHNVILTEPVLQETYM